jgi:hypothetical protein
VIETRTLSDSYTLNLCALTDPCPSLCPSIRHPSAPSTRHVYVCASCRISSKVTRLITWAQGAHCMYPLYPSRPSHSRHSNAHCAGQVHTTPTTIHSRKVIRLCCFALCLHSPPLVTSHALTTQCPWGHPTLWPPERAHPRGAAALQTTCHALACRDCLGGHDLTSVRWLPTLVECPTHTHSHKQHTHCETRFSQRCYARTATRWQDCLL